MKKITQIFIAFIITLSIVSYTTQYDVAEAAYSLETVIYERGETQNIHYISLRVTQYGSAVALKKLSEKDLKYLGFSNGKFYTMTQYGSAVAVKGSAAKAVETLNADTNKGLSNSLLVPGNISNGKITYEAPQTFKILSIE